MRCIIAWLSSVGCENCKAVEGSVFVRLRSFGKRNLLLHALVSCPFGCKQAFSGLLCRAAVGGRVKYIVDTPEVIWGSLDSSRFLDAARRFLRAEQVCGVSMCGVFTFQV